MKLLEKGLKEIDWKNPPKVLEISRDSNGLIQVFYFQDVPSRRIRARIRSPILLKSLFMEEYKLSIDVEGHKAKYQKRRCSSGVKYVKNGTEEKYIVTNFYEKID